MSLSVFRQFTKIRWGYFTGTRTIEISPGCLWNYPVGYWSHYNDVIMGAMVSQITSLTIVYSTVYSGADQRKHQCSASLAFVRGIHRWPVNSPFKWPVMRKMFPFDDVIMQAIGIIPHHTTPNHSKAVYCSHRPLYTLHSQTGGLNCRRVTTGTQPLSL